MLQIKLKKKKISVSVVSDRFASHCKMYFIILRTYEQHKLENISKRKMKCLTLNNRLIPGINTGWLRFSDIHNMHKIVK